MSSLHQTKKSKILCTLGPATNTKEKIAKLIEVGMDCVRINFSHGTMQSKRELFQMVREVSDEVAILCDIQGPKIRIGNIKEGGVILRRGHKVVLTTEEVEGDENRFTISHKQLPAEIKPGEKIFINDGIVSLEVEHVEKDEIYCVVLNGWSIFSQKGVNLPTTPISLKVPTEKDISDLKHIAELDPEYVAVSFVGDHEDVVTIRNMLNAYGNNKIKLIAKIERPVAIEKFEEILEVSDGIMVARGDLGVELPAEDVPPEQKRMIKLCNKAGKVVIVATQMLESMVKAPTPTRAEVSDVYNAIEDGADAVMLSAETASGEFPVDAVSIMSRIVKRSEERIPVRNPDHYDSKENSVSELIGHMVFSVIKELKGADRLSAKIICHTQSGHSAYMVSKYRPPLPVLGVTSNLRTAREMKLLWGVVPLLIPKFEGDLASLSRIQKAVAFCCDKGYVSPEDNLILVGNFFRIPARTNMVTIFHAKDVLGLGE